MKVKMLNTKTTVLVAVKAVAAVTIVPLGKVADFTERKFYQNKTAIQVHYIKNHMDELSNQEKYDAMCKFTDDLCWSEDEVMQIALTVCRNRYGTQSDEQRWMKSYESLELLNVVPRKTHKERYERLTRGVTY
jgi:hypothetical protein